jgi:hypothetical protein
LIVTVGAAAILWGAGALALRVQPYLIAKYRGANASLCGVVLVCAPLVAANLQGADLQNTRIKAETARLAIMEAKIKSMNAQFVPKLQGAIYDTNTRWPAGFRPEQYGATADE